ESMVAVLEVERVGGERRLRGEDRHEMGEATALREATHNEYEMTFFDTKIHTLVTHTASVDDQWLHQFKSSSSSASAAGTRPPSWSASTSSGALPSTATSRTPWPPSSSQSPPTA
ncbi:hypothetical protein Tsubulata_030707, partial [Turnera subulata]